MSKAKINPFTVAAAKSSSSSSSSVNHSPLYIAGDLRGGDGNIIYREEEIASAIHNYVEGHRLSELGEAMKRTSRGTVEDWTRRLYVNDWLMSGVRPENPEVTNVKDGSGDHLKVLFLDSVRKLNEGSFSALSSLIGDQAATENTIKRYDFKINPELLDQKIKTKSGEMTVMDAMVKALNSAFADTPDILANLFKATPVFETKKGLIDKGLHLVTSGKTAADVDRLREFLEVGCFTVQIKVGSSQKGE
mgnify:CR=1 FL=1